jgi:hypothetical protein
MNWLDWKLRWLTQEVLNWGGVRFGWTKRGVMRQLIILNIAAFLYMIHQRSLEEPLWQTAIWFFLVAFVKVFWILPCWAFTNRQTGPETCWEFTGFFRKMILILFPLFTTLTVLAGAYNFKLLIGDIEDLTYLAIFYVASCINPPPKETRKRTVLIPAHARM